MSQAQCAMIIFFKNNFVAFAEKLRNRRSKKKKVEWITRNYRTLKRQILWHCYYYNSILWFDCIHHLIKRFKRCQFHLWNVNLFVITCYKRYATTYNNHNNIIIMITFARLIITNYQVAIASSNSESFNIRLPSAIIMMLSKIESKTQHKRVLNFEFNHLPFSSDSNSDSIINFFVRDSQKRLKRINIFSDQNTFKPKSVISLTTFISSSFISLNQNIFKSRSFTSFIFINIIRK